MAAKVYLAKLGDGESPGMQGEALKKAMEATGFPGRIDKKDMVAIKLHVGEKNNVTHLRPEVAAAAVEVVRQAGGEAFLTDTSTLYRSERENAIKHALHAHAHGFSIENTGAPFIALDGLSGTHEREVEIGGEMHERVKIAGELLLADALVMISHVTGHMASGIGASIKNAGMGLSSRSGKMRQHSSITPEVRTKHCTNCGKCRKWCPEDAIEEREGVSYIVLEQCIGCGECIAVCRYGAVKFDYMIESQILQKSMAEHGAGAIKHFGEKAVYINVLVDMTKNCDCWNQAQEKAIPDMGVLASTDIVAVDQATLDVTGAAHGKDLSQISFPMHDSTIQIVHAEKVGMGTRKYELVEV